MSQDLKDLQTGPVLTLDPFLGEKKEELQPEKQEENVMDENVLTEEERKMAEQFARQIDLTKFHYDFAVWSWYPEKDG